MLILDAVDNASLKSITTCKFQFNLNLGLLDGCRQRHWHCLARCQTTFGHIFQNDTGRLQSPNFYLIFTPSLCVDNSLNCVSVNLTPVCPVSTSCREREREHSKPSSRLCVTDPPLQDKRNQCSPLKITCLVIDCSPPTSTHTNVW